MLQPLGIEGKAPILREVEPVDLEDAATFPTVWIPSLGVLRAADAGPVLRAAHKPNFRRKLANRREGKCHRRGHRGTRCETQAKFPSRCYWEWGVGETIAAFCELLGLRLSLRVGKESVRVERVVVCVRPLEPQNILFHR